MKNDARIRQELKNIKEQLDISNSELARQIGAKEYYFLKFIKGQAKLGEILYSKIMKYFEAIESNLVKEIKEEKLQEQVNCEMEKERKNELRLISKMIAEELKREERRKKLEEKRLRERKPHLFNVPQPPYNKGEWCEHLMQNDVFPKKVAK